MPRSFVVLRVSAGSLLGNQLCGKTRLQYQLDKTQHDSAVLKFIFPSYCEKKSQPLFFLRSQEIVSTSGCSLKSGIPKLGKSESWISFGGRISRRWHAGGRHEGQWKASRWGNLERKDGNLVMPKFAELWTVLRLKFRVCTTYVLCSYYKAFTDTW